MMHTRLCLALTLLHLQSVIFFFLTFEQGNARSAHYDAHRWVWLRMSLAQRNLHMQASTFSQTGKKKKKKRKQTGLVLVSGHSSEEHKERLNCGQTPTLTLFILLTPS